MHLTKKRLDFTEQRDWHFKNCMPENIVGIAFFVTFLTEWCNTILEQGQSRNRQIERLKGRNEQKVAIVSVTSK